MQIPSKLNLGSGKSWHVDFLNIDISAQWQPDIQVDFGEKLPLDTGQSFSSERFGPVVFKSNSFDSIIAYDVLEHIPNLTTCMKNCLDLLKPDGIMDVLVPYDLSYGAWQDPTHVRAFNENSWLYYTDWFWYLGWAQYRFVTDKVKLNLNPIGTQLQNQQVSIEIIARTPRAVDSMSVQLRKIALSEQDQTTLKKYTTMPDRGNANSAGPG